MEVYSPREELRTSILPSRLEGEGKLDFESLHRNIFPGRLHTLHLCSSDVDLEYVACIYIDLLSAYFLRLSIHRNFQHRNFTICQSRGIYKSKKLFLGWSRHC